MSALTKTLALSCCLLAGGPLRAQEPAAPGKRPDVIYILADDLGFSDLGCYGGEIDTPNLDRLARNGVRFTRYHSTGKCRPTRMNLMTGLYSYQAGSMVEGEVELQNRNTDRAVTVADVFKMQGYHTLKSGKWHIGTHPLECGFDRDFTQEGGAYFGFKAELDGESVRGSPEDFLTDVITDRALDFLESVKGDGEPFFLYLSYRAPHYPIQAPQECIDEYRGRYKVGWHAIRKKRLEKMAGLGLFEEMPVPAEASEFGVRDWSTLGEEERDWQDYMMATYAGMVDRMDVNIGRVLEWLEENGRMENTLILFSSDNGACMTTLNAAELAREKRIPATLRDSRIFYGYEWAFVSNTPFRYYKSTQFEGGTASPLIVHWPKGITAPKGSVNTSLAHVIDFMPTVVELTGATYPTEFEGRRIEPMQGVSLVPTFAGEPVTRAAPIYTQYSDGRALYEGDWKLVSWRLCRWQLYDLARDPTESRDLAPLHAERTREMAATWWDYARNVDRVNPVMLEPNTDAPLEFTPPTDDGRRPRNKKWEERHRASDADEDEVD